MTPSGLRIYNTLSRSIEPFSPLEAGHVRMYVCGMTIYDLCHIGHARMVMAFDVVQRWLKASGYRVTYVRNITDIDDKIIRRALERNIPIRQLTDEMTQIMHEDIGKLGIEPPTIEPRATQYIPQMLSMIHALEDKGLAYKTPSGDVNYSVRKFQGYGKLSGKSLEDLRAGERVTVDDGKADPLDFVLWKSAKPEEPADAQWDGNTDGYGYGMGRPGWHIECSAMSCHTLGETFDIHGGGADLQFPHHENEIAQTEGVTHKTMARFWMHNGFVQIDNEKMSKSLGNFFTIRDVLAKYDAETVRFFLVRGHYRTALGYSDTHLNDARTGLKRLYTALDLVTPAVAANPENIDWTNPYAQRFQSAMNDDFGTPEAIAVLYDLAGEVNRTKDKNLSQCLYQLGGVLGLLQQDPKTFLQAGAILDETAIQAKIAERAAAKAAKNFALADSIRKALLEQGIVLKDSATGTTWEVQS